MKNYTCSERCWREYRTSRNPMVKCKCGCGGRFHPRPKRGKPQQFLNFSHFMAWRRQRTERDKMGSFVRYYREYMQRFVPGHYARSTQNTLRFALTRLFEFLRSRRVRSLEKVTPKLFSEFLRERYTGRGKTTRAATGALRLFFDWAIVEGYRRSANPVIPRIHCERAPKRLPRPFSAEELVQIWKVLEKAPLPLKVAVALGQEAALRIGEVAALTTKSIDLARQEVFVGLPNKTRTERTVPFHKRSLQYLSEWLNERGELDHDRLIVTERGTPVTADRLRQLLNRLLRPTMPKWVFHRLRHTAASKLAQAGVETTSISRTFGWNNPAIAQGYLALLPGRVRQEYDRAMSEGDAKPPVAAVKSLEDFFRS